jgi:copper chaperone CopZ
MKNVLLIVLMVLTTSIFAQEKKANKAIETTTYTCNMHCASCQEKIEHNIAFEKGVKAVTSDLDDQTVTVTYRTDKSSKEAVKKALVDLGYKVEVVEKEKKKEDNKE